MSVLIILLLPLIAAALVCLPFKKSWAAGVTVASSLATLALASRLAWLASTGDSVTVGLSAGWLKWIAVDGLSALILLLIALVAATAAIYSVGYMGRGQGVASGVPADVEPGVAPGGKTAGTERAAEISSLATNPAVILGGRMPPSTAGRMPAATRKLRLYYLNYNLFVFSMLAIPVLAEPTLVWIVVELTTLCSALLVSFENTREALEAAWKYVVLSLMGAGMALLGFLVLFAAMQAAGGDGAYTWNGLIAAAPRMPPVLLQMAFLLILIGLGTKVGLVPMHTWLPDAHSQAPSPVCALLSGIETTTILYVILRLFPVMHAAPRTHAAVWAMVLGLISVGTAAFLLLQVRDYKRLFAFSTVEHMGIILTAVGLGASVAGYGAMQQILSHCVTKSFCFFAAGAVLIAMETRQIAAVRGLIRQSPLAGAALVFGGLAIAGAPPMAVFLSEFSILKAGLTQEQLTGKWGYYVVTGLLALFIVIAFFGIMLHINRMVFGASENDSGAGILPASFGEGSNGQDARATKPVTAPTLPFSCRLALVLAAIPVFVLGFYIPQPLHHLLARAAAALTQ